MTRSMVKVVVAITIGQSVVTSPTQHIKFRILTQKFLMESTKLLLLLWRKSLSPGSTCRKWYLTGWMNFIVIPTLPFSPLVLEANGYSSSDSFSTSSKKSLSVHAEVESSDTVIMLVMMTEAVNFEEQLASMKATLDRLSKIECRKEHSNQALEQADC